MNYPENMDWNAYDRAIGSAWSPAEETLSDYRALVMKVAGQAWDDLPDHSPACARDRWTRIRRDGTCKAFEQVGLDVNFDQADEERLTDALNRAMDANADGEKEAVMESLADYMDVMGAAMERGAA